MRAFHMLSMTVMITTLCFSAAAESESLTSEDACAILQDASQRAVGRSTKVSIAYEWTLKEIIGVQIRANDFNGALETLKSYKYKYGRDQILKEIAKALGRNGQLNAAFEVLNQHSDYKDKYNRAYYDDEVRIQWINQLIPRNDFAAVKDQIDQLNSNSHRSAALLKLATANCKAGRDELADEDFSLAMRAVAKSSRDVLSIARVHMSLMQTEAATKTTQRAVQLAESSDGRTKVSVLAHSAVIVAKANDQVTARKYFEKAIDGLTHVDAMNKSYAIVEIANCQAAAGLFDEALKTLSIPGQNAESTGSEKDQAVMTIAVAQFESGHVEAALRTAASIQPHPQFRDEAYQRFADHQISKGEFDKAIASAEKIENGSIRAFMLLKAAISLVDAGDENAAANVANRIELNSVWGYFGRWKYDFRDPKTWGIKYEPGGTMSSHHWSTERAAEVAAMSMTLSIRLKKLPTVSLATAFSEFEPEVIRSLSRAHTANGNVNDALAWSKLLPTSKVEEGNDEFAQDLRKNRQIYALIGVAEGILDRTLLQSP